MKKWIIIIGIISALTLLGLGFFYFILSSDNPHISAISNEARSKNIDLLYVPTNLPEGYKYQSNSLSKSNHLVSYAFGHEDPDKNIFISVQPIPENFNFVEFYNQNLGGAQEIDSSIGEAFIGSFNKNVTVSLRTDKNWMLINLPPNSTNTDTKIITNSIKQLNFN